jgi:hypothetical protein
MAANSKGNSKDVEEYGIVHYYNTCVIGLDILYEAAEAGSPKHAEILRSLAERILELAGQNL